MKQGDFSKLAKDYINRPGYSEPALHALAGYTGVHRYGAVVADIGAGTGKLTEILIGMGFHGHAVEPNDDMRNEGIRLLSHRTEFDWRKGSGEETGLPDNSVDWLLMASSFHWTDQPAALREFHRVLRPGGYFTCLWNPRDLERSELQTKIDNLVREKNPNVKRVSSGAKKYTEDLNNILVKDGLFSNLIFVSAPHEVEMTRERYMGAWRSVNDIQAQLGTEKFEELMNEIETLIDGQETVTVPYQTRSWTVKAIAK